MGLKDFDSSKLRNFRYDSIGAESDTAQTFDDGHSGTTVTGARDKILEQFLNDGEPITVNTAASVFDDTNPPTPQSYTISHAGGEATISGLKGSVAFDGLDDLKSKSILVSTWADSVDNQDLFSYMRRPQLEGYPGLDDSVANSYYFGQESAEDTPFRPVGQNPLIGYTVQLQRGGSNADRAADRHLELVKNSGDMYNRFINKRTERQAIYHIMQGGANSGAADEFEGLPAEFGTFDPIGLQAGFYPGVRGVSIGSAIFGKPSYTRDTPRIDTNTFSSENITDMNFVRTYGGDAGKFDPNADSKMLYLYKHFILTDPQEPAQGGFWAAAAAYFQNAANDFLNPILPSVNVVNSIPYTAAKTFWNGGDLTAVHSNSARKYFEDAFNEEIEIGDPTVGFYFDSKFKATNLQYGGLESKLRQTFRGTIREKFEDFDNEERVGSLEHDPTKLIVDRSVRGDNYLNDYGVVNSQGLVHKYRTLGYQQLDINNRYEDSLLTPNELNSEQLKANLEQTLVLRHQPAPGQPTNPPPGQPTRAIPEGQAVKAIPIEGKRVDGRNKVYSIGRQGLSAAHIDASKIPFDTNDPDKITYEGAFGAGQVYHDGGKLLYDGVDKVNAQKITERKNENVGGAETIGLKSNDFIPLNFYDIHHNTDIPFRASFDGDIEDSIQPTWNPTSFVGRPVSAYTYQGTERSLSFSFVVYPKTKQEFPALLEKVNYLVGLCYPNLDSFYRMSGPMIRLTVGDIIYDQMGFLTECSVTFPQDSTWETDAGLMFTKRINVSVGFQYIGDNLPLNRSAHYNLRWLNNEGTGQSYRELQNTTAEQAGALRNKVNGIGDFLDRETIT